MYYCFRVHGRRSLDRTLSGSRVFGGKSLGGFRGDHGALGLGFRVMGQYNITEEVVARDRKYRKFQ